MNEKMDTEFAPCERSSPQVLNEQAGKIQNGLTFHDIMDAVQDPVFVVNSNREIIYYNKKFAELNSLSAESTLNGMRPGEVLNCVNASKNPGGCGTAMLCKYCGMVNAIIEAALLGRPTTKECRLTTQHAETLHAVDLKIHAEPVTIENERFVVLHAADISAQKRIQVLGQVFFHDLMNTVSALSGFLDIIGSETSCLPTEFQGYFERTKRLSAILQDELSAHRLMAVAETGQIAPTFVTLHSEQIVRQAIALYEGYSFARGKKIMVSPAINDVALETDKTMIARVLGNMLKNALEATDSGGTVQVNCQLQGDKVVFSVNNKGMMPQDVQWQVFSRSFSTKGDGRGLGTYSMRLLAGRYLKGKVYFESEKETGTTFFLELPVKATKPTDALTPKTAIG